MLTEFCQDCGKSQRHAGSQCLQNFPVNVEKRWCFSFFFCDVIEVRSGKAEKMKIVRIMSPWCPGHSRQTATIRHVAKIVRKKGRLSVASKMTLPSPSSRNFTIKQPRVFEAVVWRSRTAMPNDIWIRDRKDKEGGARKVATRSMIDCSCRLSYGFVFAFLNLQYLINYRGMTLDRNGKTMRKAAGKWKKPEKMENTW